MILPLVFALLLAPPPPDRSAEKSLRDLFDAVSSARNYELQMANGERIAKDGPFYAGESVTLTRKEAEYRLDTESYWGGGLIVVFDGKQMLIDPLDDSQPAVLRDPCKLFDAHGSLAARGGWHTSPLYYMIEGKAGFDALVPATSPITAIKRDGMDGVHFEVPSSYGKVDCFYKSINGKTLPILIEYTNEGYTPPWMGERSPDDLQRWNLKWVETGDLPAELFLTQPAKGVPVSDQRTKK
ncbi:MAG: hypothetical protein JSS72_12090 [Armatimonadetes bacterium]|nr:hypothetical protein [Armatimonadota bacterium]